MLRLLYFALFFVFFHSNAQDSKMLYRHCCNFLNFWSQDSSLVRVSSTDAEVHPIEGNPFAFYVVPLANSKQVSLSVERKNQKTETQLFGILEPAFPEFNLRSYEQSYNPGDNIVLKDIMFFSPVAPKEFKDKFPFDAKYRVYSCKVVLQRKGKAIAEQSYTQLVGSINLSYFLHIYKDGDELLLEITEIVHRNCLDQDNLISCPKGRYLMRYGLKRS